MKYTNVDEEAMSASVIASESEIRWLTNTPPSDTNFIWVLKRASAETIAAALRRLRGKKDKKTARRILESRLRALQSGRAKLRSTPDEDLGL